MRPIFCTAVLALLLAPSLWGQAKPPSRTKPATASQTNSLPSKIAQLDAELFAAFNSCDLARLASYFAEDLEFYHDKAGLISSRAQFLDDYQKSICQNPDLKVRRALVKGSLAVYPLAKYGAVQTGVHRFYQTLKGQKEQAGDIAKFVHVWRATKDGWQITRIISFDHQAAK